MKTIRVAVLFVALTLSALGCGTQNDAGPPTGVPVDDAPATLAETLSQTSAPPFRGRPFRAPGSAGVAPVATTAAVAAAPPIPSYFAGPLISNPRVIVVFWGSNINFTITASIGRFYSSVLDSEYLDWLDEYYSYKAANGPLGRGGLDGSTTITPNNAATSLTDQTIGAELAQQINSGNLSTPNRDTIYMVYFPPSVSITAADCGRSCADFCACHGQTTQVLNGVSVTFAFAMIPDFFSTACSMGCGDGTNFQNTTSASAHELTEAMTDPYDLSGWRPEIGDGCLTDAAVVDSNGASNTVQNLASRMTDTCIASRPNCQRVSDLYGISPSSVSFAPGDVQTWWAVNHCTTSPGPVSTDWCQKASDMFGIAANGDVGFAPDSVQGWFFTGRCATAPRVDKAICQRASDSYGIVAGLTDGSAPTTVRNWWRATECRSMPTPQDSCQKAADLFGIVASVTFGSAPTSVRTWWQNNGCNASTTLSTLQQCQNASNYYGIEAGVSFGTAPSFVQDWWIAKGCGTSPRCQDLSELYGIDAGVTFAYAPANIQTWWMDHGCPTKPLFSANACQRAADTFGIVRRSTSSHGNSGVPGFAPQDVLNWWARNSCTGYFPRERERIAFSNGPAVSSLPPAPPPPPPPPP